LFNAFFINKIIYKNKCQLLNKIMYEQNRNFRFWVKFILTIKSEGIIWGNEDLGMLDLQEIKTGLN